MTHLEKAQLSLSDMERSSAQDCLLNDVDARAKVLVTLLYLLAVLSFPLHSTAGIIVFAIYPIVAASMSATPYDVIFRRSMVVVPFIALIGVFNPIMHIQPAFRIGTWTVTDGWLEFFSILLRGVLSVQAVLVMISSTNFYALCRSLTRMGIPSFFASQLMFVYRYIFVLIDEAVTMDRARKSRSYGRKRYSLRMYGIFVGQLLLRTVARSRRIYDTMISRGFDGSIPAMGGYHRWHTRDTLWLLIWTALFAAGRLLNVAALFNFG